MLNNRDSKGDGLSHPMEPAAYAIDYCFDNRVIVVVPDVQGFNH